MKKIFVCSRLRPWGLSAEMHEGRCLDMTPLLPPGEVCGCAGCNVKRAKALCKRVSDAGHAPYAPHLFCTQFLNDNVEAERNAGIAIGLAFLEVCDELWYDDRYGISNGMAAEIKVATECHEMLWGNTPMQPHELRPITRAIGVKTFAKALPLKEKR